MYKIWVAYDGAIPHFSELFNDELKAHEAFAKYVDWGFASAYSTVNLETPTGKMYTRHFYRKDRLVVTV